MAHHFQNFTICYPLHVYICVCTCDLVIQFYLHPMSGLLIQKRKVNLFKSLSSSESWKQSRCSTVQNENDVARNRNYCNQSEQFYMPWYKASQRLFPTIAQRCKQASAFFCFYVGGTTTEPLHLYTGSSGNIQNYFWTDYIIIFSMMLQIVYK